MGLLDDAIREHLELKRQRGADPTEVAREENDALGAVPRGPGPRGTGQPVAVEQLDEADPPPAPPVPAAPPDTGEATAEWALEDEPAPEPDPDVLQDTPEFLQETPEHDRLWFEQKPPRDFDFGGG